DDLRPSVALAKPVVVVRRQVGILQPSSGPQDLKRLSIQSGHEAPHLPPGRLTFQRDHPHEVVDRLAPLVGRRWRLDWRQLYGLGFGSPPATLRALAALPDHSARSSNPLIAGPRKHPT